MGFYLQARGLGKQVQGGGWQEKEFRSAKEVVAPSALEAEMRLLPVPRAPAWRPGQMALPTPGGSGLSTPSHRPPTCPAWAPVITRLLPIEGTDPPGEVPLSIPREIEPGL